MANATKEELEELRAWITSRFAAQSKTITAIRKDVKGAETVRELYADVPEGECVQGHDPEKCADASTYLYQKAKCRGAACRAKVSGYYDGRKATKRAEGNGQPVKAPAKRATAKKAAAKKGPAKKAVPVKAAASKKTVPVKTNAAKKAVPAAGKKPVPASVS